MLNAKVPCSFMITVKNGYSHPTSSNQRFSVFIKLVAVAFLFEVTEKKNKQKRKNTLVESDCTVLNVQLNVKEALLDCFQVKLFSCCIITCQKNAADCFSLQEVWDLWPGINKDLKAASEKMLLNRSANSHKPLLTGGNVGRGRSWKCYPVVKELWQQ